MLGAEIARYEIRRKFLSALVEQRQNKIDKSILSAENEVDRMNIVRD